MEIMRSLERKILTTPETHKYVSETLTLMKSLGIKVRDTWKDFQSVDVYNFLLDGNITVRYTPAKLVVRVEPTQFSGFSSEKAYNYGKMGGDFRSLAYLNPYITLRPEAWKDRKDHLIHEITHYLQHHTEEDSANYIGNNGNYFAYMSQRIELEALYVQMAYLMKYNRKFRRERIPKDLAAQAERVLALPFDPNRALDVCIPFWNARLF